jgi:hypothetical protein
VARRSFDDAGLARWHVRHRRLSDTAALAVGDVEHQRSSHSRGVDDGGGFLDHGRRIVSIYLVRKSGLNEAHAIYRHAAEAMAITELADFDKEAAAELAATARRMLAERLANALRSNVA